MTFHQLSQVQQTRRAVSRARLAPKQTARPPVVALTEFAIVATAFAVGAALAMV